MKVKKVSIFSKDYEKLMKRRKRIKIIVSITLVLVMILGGIVYLNFDVIKQRIANNINRKDNEENIDKDKTNGNIDELEDNSTKKPTEQNHDEAVEKEQKYEKKSVILGNSIKIDYNVDIEKKSIEKISEDEAYTYQLNEDKNIAIVFFHKTSELFSFSTDGAIKNLSYEVFIDINGKRVTRNEFLKQQPTFIWMESPKLYKDKIYYATKLPNLNNNNRYFLWICDINTGKHNGIYDKSLRAQKIVMGDVTDKGLSIDFDGKVKYFDETGKEVR